MNIKTIASTLQIIDENYTNEYFIKKFLTKGQKAIIHADLVMEKQIRNV